MVATTPQVQRTRMIEDVQETLRELQLATVPPFSEIINFFGITGIGKTCLLGQVFAHFEATHQVIWLDFTVEPDVPVQPPTQSFAAMLAVLREELPELAYLPTTVQARDGEIDPETWPVGFAATTAPPGSAEPLVLLLDHVDDLACWKWLQQELIKPLTEGRPTLVVCASQSPLFWNFWELRELCTPLAMQPFSEEETREYFRLYGRELLAPSAQQWTQGYPLQLAQLRPIVLADEPPPASEAPIDIPALLASLTPLTGKVLRYVGLLRRFEVAVKLQVLDATVPDWRGDEPPHRLLLTHVIPELTRVGYLESHRQPQCLRQGLRHALEAHLVASEPAQHQTICALLDQIYYDRFVKKPIADKPAFSEWLYFSTAPLLDACSAAARAAWQARLEALFARARLAGRELAVLLYRDSEVVLRLHRLDLLTPLKELMEHHLGADTRVPPILNSIELERYRRRVVEQWVQHTQLASIDQELPGGLLAILQTMATLDLAFDLRTLQARLNERSGPRIAPGSINRVVGLMQSCGLLTYDHSQRRYQLTSQVYALMAKGTPAAAPVFAPSPPSQASPGTEPQ